MKTEPYILITKLDRRRFRELFQYNTYNCEKYTIITNYKGKRNTLTKFKIHTNKTIYNVPDFFFYKHFKTIQECRKQKLEKINQTR